MVLVMQSFKGDFYLASSKTHGYYFAVKETPKGYFFIDLKRVSFPDFFKGKTVKIKVEVVGDEDVATVK